MNKHDKIKELEKENLELKCMVLEIKKEAEYYKGKSDAYEKMCGWNTSPIDNSAVWTDGKKWGVSNGTDQ